MVYDTYISIPISQLIFSPPFPTWCPMLESVMQSEISLKEKNKYHTLTRMCEI